MTIEPGKNFEGQKGFPTPDSVPETTACRSFSVPANDDWLGVLMGAVEVLRNEWAWYQWGVLTPAEAADAWNDIIIKAWEDSLISACPTTTVPTPYWDEDSDVDDEMENDEQVWYGEVLDPSLPPNELTFIEKASVIVMTGILAVATAEAGFAPAIAFSTIAPKMILAIRNGDVGRIIRIFIDGEKTYQGEDSGDDSITNVIVAGDEDLTEHQIYITSGVA